MAKPWARMSSLVQPNQDKWDVELDLIIALKQFEGVRVNIGMSGSYGGVNDEDRDFARNPAAANTKRLEYVLRRLASNGLKVQLGLGGEGPNPSISEWQLLNTSPVGTAWLDVKRPPLGRDDGSGTLGLIVKQCAYLKNEAIKKMRDIYLSYGLDPYEYCILELGNEPAFGGAGSPPTGSTFYTTTGLSRTTNAGLWDSNAETTALGATQGASFIEFFTREIKRLNDLDDGFKGWTCVAPTFTGVRLAIIGSPASTNCELGSYDRAASTGDNWIDLVQKKNRLLLGLNVYYSGFDSDSTGVHPELYVWPSLGPVEYSKMFMAGFDSRGNKSGDEQCFLAKLGMIRGTFRNLTSANLVQNRLAKAPIVICEAGVAHWRMGMTDTPSTQSVGAMNPNYYTNYQRVGEAQLAVLDELCEQDVEHVIGFTLSDAVPDYTSGTNWKERYGLFINLIDKDISYGSASFLQSQVAYSAILPWLERSGLPGTSAESSVSITSKGAFWGLGIRNGGFENVPSP